MAVHGRYFRQKPKELLGTDYDSRLEKRLHDVFPQLDHHPERIPYVRHHTYEPDFIYDTQNHQFLVETKGYFQDRNDCSKYPDVRDSLADHQTLVFVFENPDKPMHFQSKRKDGTKMTHREWCEKNKFLCFSEGDFGEWLTSL